MTKQSDRQDQNRLPQLPILGPYDTVHVLILAQPNNSGNKQNVRLSNN